jgi:hypothetical protein
MTFSKVYEQDHAAVIILDSVRGSAIIFPLVHDIILIYEMYIVDGS